MSGLFGEQASLQSNRTMARPSSSSSSSVGPDLDNSSADWHIYVDQSKQSLDRGGRATLDAFVSLAPSNVQVLPAILPKTSKSSKGPLVRCISKQVGVVGRPSFDVANTDSVDKVFRILTRHMKVQNVNPKVCECLKWKYKGNSHLEAGKVSLAIDAYTKALEIGIDEQEGVVLLLRASAHLQQAAKHKVQLQRTVNELVDMIPSDQNLRTLLLEAVPPSVLSKSQDVPIKSNNAVTAPSTQSSCLTVGILNRILIQGRRQGVQFRKTQYRHGLYQYALLHSAQDALRATELLPNYSTSWLKAGEILSELWKLQESAKYYERAGLVDKAMTDGNKESDNSETDDADSFLRPFMADLKRRQELLDQIRSNGWPEDTLRLGLDVAG